jgi:hypothetical protein
LYEEKRLIHNKQFKHIFFTDNVHLTLNELKYSHVGTSHLVFFTARLAASPFLISLRSFGSAASSLTLLPLLTTSSLACGVWAHQAAMADTVELGKRTSELSWKCFMLASMTAAVRMLSAARCCWRCENCCSRPQPSLKCPAWALWPGNGCCFLPVHWNTPADWTQDRISHGCISWVHQSASQPLASVPRCNSGTRRPRVLELELEAAVLWINHAPHHAGPPGRPPL